MSGRSPHFHGTTLASRELPGLYLCESRYAPGQRLHRHAHDHAFLCLTLTGAYVERYGSRMRESVPAALAFHPPGEEHEVAFEVETRCLNIELRPTLAEHIAEAGGRLESPADCGGALLGIAVRVLQAFRAQGGLDALLLEELCLHMAGALPGARLADVDRKPPAWLERARAILHARYRETFSLSELADELDLHPVYLARGFRRFTRSSVGEYVLGLRLELACRELADADTTLAEIAQRAGFFDQSHFTRRFKRTFGVTPGSFRSAMRR